MYREMIATGLEQMREWAKYKPDLPNDPWKLPKDCPLWKMDLSLAQASGILNAIHWERKTGKKAKP